MSNISNYSTTSNTNSSISHAKLNDNTLKIQQFAKHLHDFLPVLEKEFDELEAKSKTHPNDIFPIKMAALADIYNAAKPLYEWYVEKAKRTA